MTPDEKPKAAVDPKKPRRTWKQRIRIACWMAAGLVVVLRLSLYVLLPLAMRRAAGYYDLRIDYERVELSLLGGDVGVWGLTLKAPEGGEALVKTDYARAKIKPWKLLIGRLDIERLEADGADLMVDREASGRMPLAERFLKTATSTAASQGKPIDLSAPLKVDATRVTHLRAHFRDAHATPVFETTVALDLRITDMGSATKPTQFEATLAADKLVDVVRIDGDVTSAGRTLDAHINVFVRGLKLKPVAGYLSPWGIRPMADDLSMRLKGHITTGPLADPAPGVQGVLTLEEGQWTADGVEQMGLDKLTLEAQSVDGEMAKFSRLVIDGVRGRLGRSPDGYFRAAGIDFLPTVAAAPATTMPAAGPAAAGAPAFRWALGEFSLKNFKVVFHDEAVSPAADVGMDFDAIEARDRGGVPLGPGSVIDVKATGRAAGLAGHLSAQGTLTPFAQRKVLSVKLNASQIRADAIKPYLDAMRLESTLKAGELSSSLDASLTIGDGGSVSGDAHLADTRLTDGGTELFALKDVQVAGVGIDRVNGRIKAESVDISGPVLRVQRDVHGTLAALGVRTKVGGADRAAVVAGAAHPGAMVLPRMEVGRFSWKDIGVVFEDLGVTPATTITLRDAGVEIKDLLVDLEVPKQSGKTGTINAWAAAPGLMDRLSVVGAVTPGEHSIGTQLTISGNHINARVLGPYVKMLGIEPTLADGAFQCQLQASAAKGEGGVTGDVKVSELKLSDGQKELMSVRIAAVEGVAATDGAVRIKKVEITAPKLLASREGSGALVACGVRVLPATKSPSARVKGAEGSETCRIDQIIVNGAELAWRDLVPANPVVTTLSGGAEISDLTLGAPGVARLHVTGAVKDAIDRVTADGSVRLEPENLQASLTIEASGVRAGPLEGYVPSGMALTLKNGAFKTDLSAAWQSNAEGGHQGSLNILNLRLSDSSSQDPLLTVETAALHVKRFDMDHRVIEIESIGSTGVETDLHRTKAGLLEVAGLRIGGAVPEPVATAYRKLSLEGPPLVKIGQIDLRARRLRYSDESLPGPLVARDISLRSAAPVECLGRDAATLPPAKFVLATALDPIARQLQAQIALAPFAAQPLMDVRMEARGVSGAGLAAVLPMLNRYGEVGTLKEGVFKMEGGVVLRMDRRSPLDFVFSRAFGANLWLKDVGFQATADGPVLAGVKSLQADGIQVDPVARVVALKTVEVTDPVGQVGLQEGGVQAMGMLFKLPANGSSSTAPAEPSPAGETPASAPWEVRISKLLVAGIDARLEDQRVSPPLVVPLAGLEFEASNLSSKALTEPREIRFSMLANAGKVPLTKTDGSGTEQRELFSQVVGSGKLVIYPRPSGWLKMALSGMELEALSAEAGKEGFTLTRGQFDGTVDARFRGDGTGLLQMRLVLTDMRISEPAGGPVQQFLKAPTPLDGIIQALEDPDGSITVPVKLSLSNDQLSPGAVAGAVPGAVSSVVLTAIASAPIKAVKSLFGGGSKTAEQLEPVSVAFAPGVATVDEAATAQLRALIAGMRLDPRLSLTVTHEAGSGDVAREAQRSTPSVSETLSMVAQLRQTKQELSRVRVEVTGRARGQIASRFDTGAQEALARLRAIDREIAQDDDALEAVAELLKPGAQGQANRRTRAATLELSKERLAAVKSVLMGAGVQGMEDRVQMAVPVFKPVEGLPGGRITLTLVRIR